MASIGAFRVDAQSEGRGRARRRLLRPCGDGGHAAAAKPLKALGEAGANRHNHRPMTFTDDLFEKIRIRRDPTSPARERLPKCQCMGCEQPGEHRAPKGRHQEGEYYFFCLEHVKDYNKSYNYFTGMNDAAVAAFQKEAVLGHRPTWTIGVNPWGERGTSYRPGGGFGPGADHFGMHRGPGQGAHGRPEPARPKRRLRTLERRAFEQLSLHDEATGPEIKARYKELIKRYHPDANGGDRSTEDKLRQIIQAYNFLKTTGFC